MNEESTVTNILAALDFNEELHEQVNDRIKRVAWDAAKKVATDVSETLAKDLVQHFLVLDGQRIVAEMVERVVRDQVRLQLDTFMKSPEYLTYHATYIKQLASQATQELNKNILRTMIGAYHL